MAKDAPGALPNLPFEFIVKGIPRSVHSKISRRGWIKTVNDTATAAWGQHEPLETELNVTIVYFYRAGRIDVDNLIKPIMDAMKGVIYVDDAVVSQVMARRTELKSGIEIGAASTGLVTALDAERDFVLVRVSGPPDHGVIP